MSNLIKKTMWPIFVALFAGIIAVVGAYFQYKEKEEADNETKIANKKADLWNEKFEKSQTDLLVQTQKNLAKAEELSKANKKNLELSEQLNRKANDIIVLNEKLASAQEETIINITGKGHLSILPTYYDSKNLTLTAKSKSRYPIYDATIIVMNMSELRKLQIKEINGTLIIKKEDFDKYKQQLQSFTLYPDSRLDLAYTYPLTSKEYHFAFQTDSKSGATMQYSTFSFNTITNTWDHYYRIYAYNLTTGVFDDLIQQNRMLQDSHFENNFFFKKKLLFIGDDNNFED